MRILVIGGSGFIGSHVADHLCLAGHQVTIYDRVISPWLKPEHEMHIGDLLDVNALESAMKGCEVVYNFAALSDLNKALNQPVDTARVNILGNVQALDLAHRLGICRFIYASTVYVYSRHGGFYRCSKQAAESYVEEYQKLYGLDYTILRFGSLYGPRADESNGMYRLVKTALEEGRISYKGSPEAMREYIHVYDAALASVTVMGEEFRNQSIILTGQQTMRVIDLLKILSEILGYSDEIEFDEKEYYGHYIRTPYAYQPTLGKTYIPSMHVDLGQGLLQMIGEIKDSMQ